MKMKNSRPHTSIEIIRDPAGFDTLEPAWRTLTDRLEPGGIFISYDWLRSWWDAFGAEHELRILVLRDGDTITGIAPLMKTSGGKVQFIGDPDADYADFIGPDKAALARATLDHLASVQDWSTVDLAQINERSDSVAALKDLLPDYRHRHRIWDHETCLAFEYDGTEEERRLFRVKRGKSLKNQFNFFRRRGELSLEPITDKAKILNHLPNLFQCHITRWAGTSTPSYFRYPETRAFFVGLTKRLAERGGILLLALQNGDKTIAYFFCFAHQGVICLYTPSYNVYFSRRSPGKILNHLLLEYFVHNGYTELDYTRGAEGYKSKFTNRTSTNYRFTIYAKSWQEEMVNLYEKVKAIPPVRKAIDNPKVQDTKTRLVHRVREDGPLAVGADMIRQATGRLFANDKVVRYGASGEDVSRISAKTEDILPDQIEELGQLLGFAEDSTEATACEARFEAGEHCVGLRQAGVMVALAWIRESDREVVITNPWLSSLAEDTTVLYDLLNLIASSYANAGKQIVLEIGRDNPTSGVLETLGWQFLS
jgi:CelD/BcsL family acetyltransferase involved in cellulose biosynthesis